MCKGTECYDLYKIILWKNKRLHPVCKEAQKNNSNLEVKDETDTEASGSQENWKLEKLVKKSGKKQLRWKWSEESLHG